MTRASSASFAIGGLSYNPETGLFVAPEGGWVCLHCNERFYSIHSARRHFGSRPDIVAKCIRQMVATDRDWECEWCHCRAYGEVADNREEVRCINCKRLGVAPGFELLFALELAANRLAAAAVNAIGDHRLSSEYSEWSREARAVVASARATP